MKRAKAQSHSNLYSGDKIPDSTVNGNSSSNINGSLNGHELDRVSRHPGQKMPKHGEHYEKGTKEKTPDQEDVDCQIARNYQFSQAPQRNAPTERMAPPIIRTKIKPNEVSLETNHVSNGRISNKITSKQKTTVGDETMKPHGSKLPQAISKFSIKEKSVDFSSKALEAKLHMSKNGCSIKESTVTETKLLTVKVSKGIEMKRVETKIVDSNLASSNNKEDVQKKTRELKRKNEGYESRVSTVGKQTKKSTLDQTSIKTKVNGTGKHDPDAEKAKIVKRKVTKSVHLEEKQPEGQVNQPKNVEKVEREVTGAGEGNETLLPIPPVETYKTLKEFLNMPAVSIPDAIPAEPEKPKTLYKSKFWDYIDPTKQESTQKTEKPKPHDPSVKTFMEKQKEARRLKNLADFEARQQMIEKKKKQLQELNEKSRLIVSKKEKQRTSPSQNTTDGKKPEVEKLFVNSSYNDFEPRSDKGLKANDATSLKKGTLTSESSPAINVSNRPDILKEFEAIVKRECINFFATKKLKQSKEASTSSQDHGGVSKPPKHSKSSSTTTTSTSSLSDHQFRNVTRVLNSAATKIQSAFRGYQIRKLMSEARLLANNSIQLKKSTNDSFKIKTEEIRQRQPRRISFYKSPDPEKPYDGGRSRLKALPVSPSRSQSLNNTQESYIPPSPFVPLSPRGSHHPQVLTPLSINPAKFRTFNEPYPREAIKKIKESQQESPAVSRRNSMSELLRDRLSLDFLTNSKGVVNTASPKSSAAGAHSDSSNAAKRRKSEKFIIPQPSISDVLYEKLRLLAAENKTNNNALRNSNSGNNLYLEQPCESDIESVSSIARPFEEEEGNEVPSQDVSITDDYFGPSSSSNRKRSSTPNQFSIHSTSSQSRLGGQKLKESSSSSPMSSSSASTTTVETDIELLPSKDTAKNQRSSTTPLEESSSKTLHPTSSTFTTPGLKGLPIPALKLQYHAEKERLDILEKALQATIHYDKARKADKNQKAEIEEIAKAAADTQVKLRLSEQAEMIDRERFTRNKTHSTTGGNDDSLKLAMMKCQQEAAKSTAEMSKWMVELKKSHIEEQKIQNQQRPIDLAVIVSAAVDEARRIVDDNRRNRDNLKRSHASQNVSINVKHVVRQEDKNFQFPSGSEPESNTLDEQENNNTEFEDNYESSEFESSDNSESKRTTDVEENEQQQSENLQEFKSEDVEYEPSENLQDITSEQTDNLQSEKYSCIHTEQNEDIESESARTAEVLSVTEQIEEDLQSVSEHSEDVESQIMEDTKSVTEQMEEKEPSFTEQVEEDAPSVELDNIKSQVEDQKSFTEQINDFESIHDEEVESEAKEIEDVESVIEEVLKDDESIAEEIEDHVESEVSEHIPQALSATEQIEDLKYVSDHIEDILSQTEEFVKSLPTQAEDIKLESSAIEREKSLVADKEEFEIEEVEDLKSVTVSAEEQSISRKSDVLKPSAEQVDEVVEQSLHDIKSQESIKISEENKTSESMSEKTDFSSKPKENVESMSEHKSNFQDSSEEFVPEQKVDLELKEDEKSVSEEIEEHVSEKDNVQSISEQNSNLEFESKQLQKVNLQPPSEQKEDENCAPNESKEHEESFGDDVKAISEVLSATEQSISEHIEDVEDSQSMEESKSGPELMENKNNFTEVAEKVEEEDVREKGLDDIKSQINKVQEENEDFDSISEDISKEISVKEPIEDLKHVEDVESNVVEDMKSETEQVKEENDFPNETEPIEQVDEMEKIRHEQQCVENEIRQLEALQAQNSPIAVYLSALELQEKPPPPYSPPSSESLSYSSKSFFVAVEDQELKTNVVNHVSQIWDTWRSSGRLPEFVKQADLTETDLEVMMEQDDENNKGENLAQWATSSFNLLISDVITECIKIALQVEDSSKDYVDRVRRGPMAVQAQKLRIPNTEEALVAAVYNLAVPLIPKTMLPDDMKEVGIKQKTVKWSCRPRDVVEDILVEEMIEEEPLWTELWPEELLIKEELCEKILQESIKEVIRNFEIAFRQESEDCRVKLINK